MSIGSNNPSRTASVASLVRETPPVSRERPRRERTPSGARWRRSFSPDTFTRHLGEKQPAVSDVFGSKQGFFDSPFVLESKNHKRCATNPPFWRKIATFKSKDNLQIQRSRESEAGKGRKRDSPGGANEPTVGPGSHFFP